jgi:hypothetical protein
VFPISIGGQQIASSPLTAPYHRPRSFASPSNKNVPPIKCCIHWFASSKKGINSPTPVSSAPSKGTQMIAPSSRRARKICNSYYPGCKATDKSEVVRAPGLKPEGHVFDTREFHTIIVAGIYIEVMLYGTMVGIGVRITKSRSEILDVQDLQVFFFWGKPLSFGPGSTTTLLNAKKRDCYTPSNI